MVANRDAAAARGWLRDSVRTFGDLNLAVSLGTFDSRAIVQADRPALIPCAELTASIERNIGTVSTVARPLGVSAAEVDRLRSWRLRALRSSAATCGVPYAERQAIWKEYVRKANETAKRNESHADDSFKRVFALLRRQPTHWFAY